MYGEGISRIAEILDMGVKYGIIDKAGSFYSYNDERIGQGEANARQWIKEHSEIAEEMLSKIMDKSKGIVEDMQGTGDLDESSESDEG